MKKSVATLVALLTAIGLSLTATSPAVAAGETFPGGGQNPKVNVCHWSSHNSAYEVHYVDAGGVYGWWGQTAHKDHSKDIIPAFPGFAGQNLDKVPKGTSVESFIANGCKAPQQAPAPAPQPKPTQTQQTAKQYGVGLYIYKKVDAKKAAAWENSGLQTLVKVELGRSSKQANGWLGLTPADLPSWVCGPGWGVQQDKVEYKGSFTFPQNIQYPVDNIGWPPLYEAKHWELSKLVAVPDCAPPPPAAPATASVSVTPATCDAPETAVLGSIQNATWGALSGATGPGTYSVTATAIDPHRFEGGKKTATFTGELAGPLAEDDPSCAPPPPPGCEEDCASLEGSTAVGECVADVAWIFYTVVLDDPMGEVTDREAHLLLQAGNSSISLPLGTVPDSGELTGKVLWPGASVDPETGEPTGWPGWVLVDGVWQQTDDPAYFGWTRSVTSAIIQVNPDLEVALAYPPATPDCDTNPPQDPPTLGVFPTNVQLGEKCDPNGRGVVTLGDVDGVSFFEDVDYFVDGVKAESATLRLAPGTYVITASPKNPGDGIDGESRWQVTIGEDGVCGDLTTLALTGDEDTNPLLALAALLVMLGFGSVMHSRMRMARQH